MPKSYSRVRYRSLSDNSTNYWKTVKRWICFRVISHIKSIFLNRTSVKFLFLTIVTIVTIQQLCSIHSSPFGAEDIAKNIRGLWTYQCVDNMCRRTRYKVDEKKPPQMSLNVCKLKCGSPPGALWPLPTGRVTINEQSIAINPNNIKIENVAPANAEMTDQIGRLYLELHKSFKSRLTTETQGHNTKSEGYGLHLKLEIEDTAVVKPTLNMDESYHLQVETNDYQQVQATITAKTYFGARHATETLNQLIVFDDVSSSLVMPIKVEIRDHPVYKYRALSLDTSRNFLPIKAMKRTIDGMASVKMNVLHWHISDTHTFPLESKTFPYLTIYGAYGPDQFYSQRDVEDLVAFARWKGVKIIPEFDAPAHVGEGWQWAEDTLITYNAQPWYKYCLEPPCGQLNPISEKMYEILKGIQTDLHNLFDISEVFHMGGDEVNLDNWRDNKEIQDYMKTRGWNTSSTDSLIQLWDDFQKRAYTSLQQVTRTSPQVILWTNTLTEQQDIDRILDKSHYIIQVWTTGKDKRIKMLAEEGYRMIFSNYDALYLDCGFGGWVRDGHNWCSPYNTWQQIYANDMSAILKNVTGSGYIPEMDDLIYGASAPIWSEQIDEHNLDDRVWPRLAALAERLWTNPSTAWQAAEFRFLHHRERLVRFGIHPEALQPQWCRQHEGDCPDRRKNLPIK